MSTTDVALFIEPPSPHFLGDKLFAPETAQYGGDNVLAPYLALRDFFVSRNVPIHTSDRLPASNAKRNIYVSLGMRDHFRRYSGRDDVILSAFFAMECPVVEPALYADLPRLSKSFRRICSWSDSESLLPVTKTPVRLEPILWPQSFDEVHEELWARKDRKFLVMMNANKLPRLYWNELYTERLRALEFFSRTDEIDLYGRGWDGPPFRMGYGGLPGSVQFALRESERLWLRVFPDAFLAAARRAWRGAAKSKSETISAYDFAICFENSILRGWLTEKIFDCLFAGAIPVYLGAPEIAERIPKECFIDMREFSNYAELRNFLKSLSPSDIQRYREAGRDFISSAAFEPFSKQAFVDIFRRFVVEDSGVRL